MSAFVELPYESYPKDLSADLSNGGDYSFETAGAMAWLSQLCYETDHSDKVDSILGNWGLARVATLENPPGKAFPRIHTRGLIVRGWGGTIIGFAGTDPAIPENWVTDFSALPSPSGMHGGFERAAKTVWQRLRQTVRERDEAHRPLFFTGHSLGAALAVVSAHAMAREEAVIADGVYTFGMPRCGGQTFVQDYRLRLGQQTYRLVHGYDIVATVPPSIFGFRHVGRFLACRSGQKLDRKQRPQVPDSDEPRLSMNVLWGALADLRLLARLELPPKIQPGEYAELFRRLPAVIRDHIPVSYLTALGVKPAALGFDP